MSMLEKVPWEMRSLTPCKKLSTSSVSGFIKLGWGRTGEAFGGVVDLKVSNSRYKNTNVNVALMEYLPSEGLDVSIT